MKRKLAVIAACYCLLHLTCLNPPCDCPDVQYPYFDYKGISVLPNTTKLSPAAPDLSFFIKPDSFFLTAENRGWRPTWDFSLSTPAYACSCTTDGDEGDKYPIRFIRITSDRDYNPERPAGSLLNTYFDIRSTIGGDAIALTPLTDDYDFRGFMYAQNQYTLLLNIGPVSVDKPVTFRFDFIRPTKGDTITVYSDPIEFF